MNDNSMSNHINEAVSGAVAPSFEGVSPQFTHRQLVATRRSTMLWKAKRYGRWFMLKALKPDCAADVAHQQLLIKEFNTLMAIQHPGVVNCYGMETVDGAGMCIVMEYVEGESLKQWLAAEHSLHESERVLGQLLDAVVAIHQAGIVHRDLKPENVMIAHLGGQVKIIDFGLADADDYALFKQPAGTQGYASEEQSQGGDARFTVLGSERTRLVPGTTFKCHMIIENEPMWVSEVTIDGTAVPAYVCGRDTGIHVIEES